MMSDWRVARCLSGVYRRQAWCAWASTTFVARLHHLFNARRTYQANGRDPLIHSHSLTPSSSSSSLLLIDSMNERMNRVFQGEDCLFACRFEFCLSGGVLCFRVIVDRKRLRSLHANDFELMSLSSNPKPLQVVVGPLGVGGRAKGRTTVAMLANRSYQLADEWWKMHRVQVASSSNISQSSTESHHHHHRCELVNIDIGFATPYLLPFPAECVFRYIPPRLPANVVGEHLWRSELNVELTDSSSYAFLHLLWENDALATAGSAWPGFNDPYHFGIIRPAGSSGMYLDHRIEWLHATAKCVRPSC